MAWMLGFSSTLRTKAFSGGFKYNPPPRRPWWETPDRCSHTRCAGAGDRSPPGAAPATPHAHWLPTAWRLRGRPIELGRPVATAPAKPGHDREKLHHKSAACRIELDHANRVAHRGQIDFATCPRWE